MPPPADPATTRVTPGIFATTHWTTVLHARESATPEAAAALERLCQTYWYPLYAYVRRKGFDVHQAQDLTQGYFAQLLEKRYFDAVRREKGKFRSFLVTTLNHFLVDEWRHRAAEKRGGGKLPISLDVETAEGHYQLEPVSDETPETIFDRRWAITLLDQAMNRLREEFTAAGKERHFQCLKGFLGDTTESGSYAAAATQLGMTANAVGVMVHRLRQRYRELVREEIAHTVSQPEEIDEEMRALFAALA